MANRNIPPSLDMTGTQAAIYPSEDTLWAVGPPINDPGGQGVVEMPAGPSAQEAAHLDVLIYDQLNDETSNEAYSEGWVNPQVYGEQGFGAFNEQDFQSGHTQIILSNPSAEQGWGVGPARRWAHYPIEDSPNPYRNRMNHMRNGQLAYVSSESSLYERAGLAWEEQFSPYKQRSPLAPVVPVPASVPFVATVPTWGGGAIPHPGVDQPLDDSMLYGVYP